MTESELLALVTSNGWTIIESKQIGQEGTGDNLLAIMALLTVKPVNGVMLRQWLNYYKKLNGTCIWRENNPFPASPVVTFYDKVSAKINALVAAGTIKAGYVEKSNEIAKTALVVAVGTSNDFKPYHVWEDASQVIQVVALTGTYPI